MRRSSLGFSSGMAETLRISGTSARGAAGPNRTAAINVEVVTSPSKRRTGSSLQGGVKRPPLPTQLQLIGIRAQIKSVCPMTRSRSYRTRPGGMEDGDDRHAVHDLA